MYTKENQTKASDAVESESLNELMKQQEEIKKRQKELEGTIIISKEKKQEYDELEERLRKREQDLNRLKLSQVYDEAIKNMLVITNMNTFETIFGRTIQKLIPFQLNDNAYKQYYRLFEGYYRDIVLKKGGKELLPRDVTNLISSYYPLFGLESEFSVMR